MEPQTIFANGHAYTSKQLVRSRSSQYDASKKVITKNIPQPYYNGIKNMALTACRKLTPDEIKALQHDAN